MDTWLTDQRNYGGGVSCPSRHPGELLPFTVDTQVSLSTEETRFNLNCSIIKGMFV